MTSYSPQTRFAAMPEKWLGSDNYRFATREEAEDSLARVRATREDLLETRIVELPWKATHMWIQGSSVPRGQKRDLRSTYSRGRK